MSWNSSIFGYNSCMNYFYYFMKLQNMGITTKPNQFYETAVPGTEKVSTHDISKGIVFS